MIQYQLILDEVVKAQRVPRGKTKQASNKSGEMRRRWYLDTGLRGAIGLFDHETGCSFPSENNRHGTIRGGQEIGIRATDPSALDPMVIELWL